MKRSGGRKQRLREDVDKVEDGGDRGCAKRSKSRLEVRRQAGVRVGGGRSGTR